TITSLSAARYSSSRSSIAEGHSLGGGAFRTLFGAVRGSLDGPILRLSESAECVHDVLLAGPAGMHARRISGAARRSDDCLFGAISSLEPGGDRPWSAPCYRRCLPRPREPPTLLREATFRPSPC